MDAISREAWEEARIILDFAHLEAVPLARVAPHEASQFIDREALYGYAEACLRLAMYTSRSIPTVEDLPIRLEFWLVGLARVAIDLLQQVEVAQGNSESEEADRVNKILLDYGDALKTAENDSVAVADDPGLLSDLLLELQDALRRPIDAQHSRARLERQLEFDISRDSGL